MKIKLIILLLLPVLLFSQFNKNGMQVNVFKNYSQHESTIAVNNSNGEFIVVWTSESQDGDGDGIFAQYFDINAEKIGEEFQVNSNSEFDQNKPAVAMNDEGVTVIVWSETRPDSLLQDIYCAVYDKDRKKIYGDFLVNTTTDKSQNWADVAMDAEGNFVVVWHCWVSDGSDRAVCAQRFNSNCEKIGEEFVVNTYTRFSQCLPSIAMNPDGRFIISWQSWFQESNFAQNYGVYAQLFDENGDRVGGEIHVNTRIDGDQFYPRNAMNKDGDFIIVWTNWIANSTSFGDIAAQRFNKNGEKVGGEFIVNSTVLGYQHFPDVVMRDDGSFTVVWGSWEQDGSMEGVFLQRFDSDGSKVNEEEQVNIYYDNFQWEPRIALLPNGNTTVVYSSWGEFSNSEYDIVLRILEPALISVYKNDVLPTNYSLKQNYPNPFNPSTNIEFSIPKATQVSLRIYNVLGQEVSTLVNEMKEAGTYIARFDGKNLPSGIYYYAIKAGNYSATKKMMLIK